LARRITPTTCLGIGSGEALSNKQQRALPFSRGEESLAKEIESQLFSSLYVLRTFGKNPPATDSKYEYFSFFWARRKGTPTSARKGREDNRGVDRQPGYLLDGVREKKRSLICRSEEKNIDWGKGIGICRLLSVRKRGKGGCCLTLRRWPERKKRESFSSRFAPLNVLVEKGERAPVTFMAKCRRRFMIKASLPSTSPEREKEEGAQICYRIIGGDLR